MWKQSLTIAFQLSFTVAENKDDLEMNGTCQQTDRQTDRQTEALLITCLPYLAYSSAMKMETICYSELWVNSTFYIPENNIRHNDICKSIKSIDLRLISGKRIQDRIAYSVGVLAVLKCLVLAAEC
jgi:hypothetical protein